MNLPLKTSRFLQETGEDTRFGGRFFAEAFRLRYEVAEFETYYILQRVFL